MKILNVGGTRFIGPCIVRRLIDAGCEVMLFHRGLTETQLSPKARHVHGDQKNLDEFIPQFKSFAPEVALHMRASTRFEAETFMRCMRGMVRRVVVPSSQDVYRAYGRLHKTEPGPPAPVPLTENAPLRKKLSIHGEGYEKRWVEQVVMSDPEVTGTILRYPAVYGPGDYRLYEITRRMLDNRPAILLERTFASWRWTHGYVEDIAQATVLAVMQEKAADRIYNCGERDALSRIDLIRRIARVAKWNGEIRAPPIEQMPAHLRDALAWEQDWICDTTRIRNELGFRELNVLDDRIAATIAWHRENPRPIDPKEFDYAAEDAAIAAVSRQPHDFI